MKVGKNFEMGGKQNHTMLCIGRQSKWYVSNIYGMPEGIKLKLTGHVEKDVKQRLQGNQMMEKPLN